MMMTWVGLMVSLGSSASVILSPTRTFPLGITIKTLVSLVGDQSSDPARDVNIPVSAPPAPEWRPRSRAWSPGPQGPQGAEDESPAGARRWTGWGRQSTWWRCLGTQWPGHSRSDASDAAGNATTRRRCSGPPRHQEDPPSLWNTIQHIENWELYLIIIVLYIQYSSTVHKDSSLVLPDWLAHKAAKRQVDIKCRQLCSKGINNLIGLGQNNCLYRLFN